MILKRPYAFLIKYFKIIHALLLLCSLFLIYKTWALVSFLGSLIREDLIYDKKIDYSVKYITPLMFIFTFLIIILCGIIVYLLKYKKKKVKSYVLIISIYILVLLFYFYMSSFLYGLSFSAPSIRFINIIRDIVRVVTIIQLPVAGMCFVRALGFDVKRFDFKKDLLDLGVEEKDNEEYEFDFKLDPDEIKFKINRGLRFAKYFYKDNIVMFRVVEIGLAVLIVANFALFLLNRETIYSENQYVSVGSDLFEAKVLDSYKIINDTRGNTINTQNFFVVTKLRISNKTNYSLNAKIISMKLIYDDKGSTLRTTAYDDKFSDLGTPYYGQTFEPKETKDYIFIYQVPIEYYYSTFYLGYFDNIHFDSNGHMVYDYKKVKLSPEKFKEKQSFVGIKRLGEELDLSATSLGDTTLKIDEVKVEDSFDYNIVKCNKGKCDTRVNFIKPGINTNFALAIMRIKYDLDFDYETLGVDYTNSDFLTKFGSIRFIYDGKEYNNRLALKDVTPFTTDNYAFVEVRRIVKDAQKVYLDLTIRDKVYSYLIVDNSVVGNFVNKFFERIV